MNDQDILNFWFSPEHRSLWFAKSEDFDAKIRDQFTDVHRQATRAELWSWRKTPEGRLAEIIVLDQFSRNIYRDQPESFAYDGLALALSQKQLVCNSMHNLTQNSARFCTCHLCIVNRS